MDSRRTFLKATGAAVGTWAARRAGADEPKAERTWLDYAVNVEMTWNNLPFLDRVRKVADAGFTFYEFWPWRNKDVDAIAKLNDRLGLKVAQFSASPKTFAQGITDPARRSEFVEDIKLAVGVAKRLNAPKICVVAGEETKGYGRDEQTRAVVDALKAGADVVEPAGVTILLEPLNILVDHPRQLLVTSAQAADVLRAVGSKHVKMLFDVYHQQISEGNLSGNIRKYKDLIGYFQIADHPGRHEPGTGEIRYAHVLRVIHDIGYRDPIGMELSPRADPLAAFRAVRAADAEARAGADGH